MTARLRVGIAGHVALGPMPEIGRPLDDLIYDVVTAALADAGLTVDDVDGVCMAASDLIDGRAISTMTLTGSTGSLRRNELRVCNESLAALWMGTAEVAASAADALVVTTWSKLSDADGDAIEPLALEPVFHRGLGFHPAAIPKLRESAERGTTTVLAPRVAQPMDAAAAVVLTAPEHRAAGRAAIVGVGAATGPYLRLEGPLLAPVGAAVREACERADARMSEFASVIVVGLDAVEDRELAQELGAGRTQLQRLEPRGQNLGYAGGLVAVDRVLEAAQPGLHLVASVGGVGLDNAHAVVLEVG